MVALPSLLPVSVQEYKAQRLLLEAISCITAPLPIEPNTYALTERSGPASPAHLTGLTGQTVSLLVGLTSKSGGTDFPLQKGLVPGWRSTCCTIRADCWLNASAGSHGYTPPHPTSPPPCLSPACPSHQRLVAPSVLEPLCSWFPIQFRREVSCQEALRFRQPSVW
uniref:Uncharacterized protein n=1 Tax=Eutreptiella gymnastica TaxID=73025 RepID=A0A6U8N3I0_9EUGL|mmetsp:Transcript_86050/g.150051  ORF Transcript_86050/g.150051 Transcript_86050/m.150051 type:complete len:166 (+) Transcript_86050:379-876(+)